MILRVSRVRSRKLLFTDNDYYLSAEEDIRNMQVRIQGLSSEGRVVREMCHPSDVSSERSVLSYSL